MSLLDAFLSDSVYLPAQNFTQLLYFNTIKRKHGAICTIRPYFVGLLLKQLLLGVPFRSYCDRVFDLASSTFIVLRGSKQSCTV